MQEVFIEKKIIGILLLNSLKRWFMEDEGRVAIYDATNVERSVRNDLSEFARHRGFKIFFIESECNDPAVIQTTVREVR